MVIDYIISIAVLVALFFSIAIIYVLKEKLDALGECIKDIQTYMDSTDEQVSEEDESKEEDKKGLENLASSVFNLVDEILDGKKELEDIDNEEQSNI
jgi:hypothetical protein